MRRAVQGDVFLADVAPRIGFEGDPEAGRLPVVVLQGNAPNSVLETLIAAPLALASEERIRFPLHVRIPPKDLGGLPEHVAKVQLLRPFARSRLSPEPLARVSPATLALLRAAVARLFR